MKIECEGTYVLDNFGERIQTSKPRMDIYIPKGYERQLNVGDKFKVIIELKDVKEGESEK